MPDREVVHVVLGADPRVHVSRVTSAQLAREIFPVHVVKQFCHLAHVEDVKVEKIIRIHQLTQHWLSCQQTLEINKYLRLWKSN